MCKFELRCFTVNKLRIEYSQSEAFVLNFFLALNFFFCFDSIDFIFLCFYYNHSSLFFSRFDCFRMSTVWFCSCFFDEAYKRRLLVISVILLFFLGFFVTFLKTKRSNEINFNSRMKFTQSLCSLTNVLFPVNPPGLEFQSWQEGSSAVCWKNSALLPFANGRKKINNTILARSI